MSSLYNIGQTTDRTHSQTVTFRDGNSEWTSSMASAVDDSRHQTVHGDVSLSEFFQRPIAIYRTTWTPGTAFTVAQIDPWSLYITNPRVVNRLSNYALFSGKLCLKLVVNGNSFYYGRIMAYYKPLPRLDAVGGSTGGLSNLIQGSQKLKVFINPTESTAGTLECPFLWPNDMVLLATPSGVPQYADLGRLVLQEVNGLKHANGATTPVSITVFAWMEDVKLSAPTAIDISGITAQASDEYGDSPVSKTATAVAGLAGRMTSMPIIGPYARATQLGAGALGGIAKMFGYSRPTQLEEPRITRHHNVGELAVTDTPDTVNKLTIDSKQELSIDPRIVGVGNGDEMGIADIAARESFVGSFLWAVGTAPDTRLVNIRVNPCHAEIENIAGVNYYTIPACCYAAMPFKYWRGIMKYRFQIVASEYHKGRLKFVWDPVIGGNTPESNVQYTKIVDLSSERDFTLDVPWGATTTWLDTLPVPTGLWRVNPAYTSDSTEFANGVVSVYVMNDLTTPNSTVNNDIQINLFMSMCDAEFAAPSDYTIEYSPVIGVAAQSNIEAQSDVEHSETAGDAPEAGESTESMIECNMEYGALATVYMGERVTSFRALCKRYAIDWIWGFTGSGGFTSFSTCDFPMVYGYTNNGFQTGAINKYNTGNTTMMRYMCLAFLAYRGGVRRKYVFSDGSSSTSFGTASVKRNTSKTVAAPVTTNYVTTNDLAASLNAMTALPSGIEGSAMTAFRQNQGLEVEFPFYHKKRFVAARVGVANANTTIPCSVEDLTHTVTYIRSNTNGYVASYVAAAEDASFFCFQGCMPFSIAPILT